MTHQQIEHQLAVAIRRAAVSERDRDSYDTLCQRIREIAALQAAQERCAGVPCAPATALAARAAAARLVH